MSDTKFTPGPLTVRRAGKHATPSGSADCAVVAEDKFIVAECYSNIRRYDEFSRDEAMANATLYAASPDLYAALTEALFAMDDHAKAYPALVKGYTIDAMRSATAALAKARGEA